MPHCNTSILAACTKNSKVEKVKKSKLKFSLFLI